MKKIRERIGAKAIAPNANADVVASGYRVDRFYKVKKVMVEVKKSVETEVKGTGKGNKSTGKGGKGKSKKVITVMEEKDVVYIEECSDFINWIIKERGLDPQKTTVLVSMDAGQETLKIMASIFDDAEGPDNDDDDDDNDGDRKAKTKPNQQKLNSGCGVNDHHQYLVFDTPSNLS